MNITTSNQKLLELKAQTLVLFLFEEEPIFNEILQIDQEVGGIIQIALKEEKFTAKKGEVVSINIGKKLGFTRVLLMGLGKKSKLSSLILKQSIGVAVKILSKNKIQKIAIFVQKIPSKKLQASQISESLVIGAITSEYQFTEYKTVKKDLPTRIKELTFYTAYPLAAFNKGLNEGEIIADAINNARDYGNQPSNKATPTYLVSMA